MIRFNQTPNSHRQVVSGKLVFLSGITAASRSPEFTSQISEILKKMDDLLSEVGSNRDAVVSATIFLTNIEDKTALNDAWRAHFSPSSLPARTVVQVAGLGEGVMAEVAIVAETV